MDKEKGAKTETPYLRFPNPNFLFRPLQLSEPNNLIKIKTTAHIPPSKSKHKDKILWQKEKSEAGRRKQTSTCW